MSNRANILIIDDKESMRDTCQKALSHSGNRVEVAEDGMKGLAMLKRESFDLVILDLKMPKMDGITLIKKLKSQLTTRFIPIIMVTAKDEIDSEVKGIDAGADDYLTKPVHPKNLLARVNRLLKRPSIAEI